jgi:adenylate cyclase
LVPIEYSLLTVLMLFVVNVMISYYTETSKKQRLMEAFSHYVPPEVVARISHDPDRFTLEGESRELSVMFSDVHNFTGIAEDLGPKQLADLLNALFTPLTEVLYKHHATIDKYIGDSIMAFWGAPLEDPRHAQNALSAALEMQEVVKRLAPVFRERGWPELTMGIGINTGVMNVGNMGSKYRMAYTVIGDAVNLASRLQQLTRFYKTGIIVGEGTKQAFPVPIYRELGLVQVKGKNRYARIYEPTNPAADPESTMVENMNRHNKALKHYYNREWDEARALFEALETKRDQDPLYPYYLRRIEEFRVNPPPEGWQGQVEFTVK